MWYCCQRGAREHYALPRMLHRTGLLAALLTDMWLPDIRALRLVALHGRSHPDLGDALVHSATVSTGLRLLREKFQRQDWFQVQEGHNEAFEQACGARLTKLLGRFRSEVVFAYSYAALRPLQVASDLGAATVLGQIDPGRLESQVIAEEFRRIKQPLPPAFSLPNSYWDDWREECNLAKIIVANSEYSRDMLMNAGIVANKIRVIPCALGTHIKTNDVRQTATFRFDLSRPLRVLSVGQISVRKGAHETFAAAKELKSMPVDFRFVGTGLDFSSKIPENVTLIGQVPRLKMQKHYQWADVLLFPTLSDGFGLVQLEALANGVPVIASMNCAQVVTADKNGMVLPLPHRSCIKDALCRLIDEPYLMETLKNCATLPERFSFATVGQAWLELNDELVH